MKVLITGSRGFVGKAVLEHLRARGHEVVGAVRRKDLADFEVCFDICKRSDYDALPRDVDAIVHSAAVVASERFSKSTMQINAEGTRHLAGWARRNRIPHFVHISSIAAYGTHAVGEERREDTGLCRFPLHPAYLRSKAQAERYLMRARIPYTTLRLPGIFGAGDTVATPAIVPAILRGAVPWVWRKDRRITTLYVHNFADMVEQVLQAGPQNEAFNCADGETTWEQFVEEYGKVLDRQVPWDRRPLLDAVTNFANQEFGYVVTNGYLGAHFPADKFRDALGYRPRLDWRQGVQEAVHAYLDEHGEVPITAGLATVRASAG